MELCTTEEDEEKENFRSFPAPLMEKLEQSRDETLIILSRGDAGISSPLMELSEEDDGSSLLTYLLSWLLLLRIFKTSPYSERAAFANFFHRKELITELMTSVLCLMPEWVEEDTVEQLSLSESHLELKELKKVAYHVLLSCVESIPALVQSWFNNQLDRKQTSFVSRFIASQVSPYVLRNEFERLDRGTKSFSNMSIKTRANAREIAAVYTMEEMSMDLQLKLADNHPLSPVSVECGKRVAVSNSQWRQWMLQLTRFLHCQNGTILDGLLLWKKNVDKQFEGVEECMICFSVLHGTNYSLPSIGCQTCKKKFHAACLYKWFNTSQNSTCPLCRNIF
jgi:hypothetical protein